MRKSPEPCEIREAKLLTNQLLLTEAQSEAQGLESENTPVGRQTVSKGEEPRGEWWLSAVEGLFHVTWPAKARWGAPRRGERSHPQLGEPRSPSLRSSRLYVTQCPDCRGTSSRAGGDPMRKGCQREGVGECVKWGRLVMSYKSG